MIAPSYPILTIAIPTYNRSNYLDLCLTQFGADKILFDDGSIELIVMDNCSDDDTPLVVSKHQKCGLNLTYIRHSSNIGSDANFAECFNRSSGHYVQILGDDDLFLPGMLSRLLNILKEDQFGVVMIKGYGYERDFMHEHPGGSGERKEFNKLDSYLYEVGQNITFISACIINKHVQREADARIYCGTNLVQVNLVFTAMLRIEKNLAVTEYFLACKRANSGGYDFSEVFIDNLFKIARSYRGMGMTDKAINALGQKMLLVFYPFCLLRTRIENKSDILGIKRRFQSEFGTQLLYVLLNAPILYLPRPIAIIWALVAVFIGRTINGELRRGIFFGFNRLFRK